MGYQSYANAKNDENSRTDEIITNPIRSDGFGAQFQSIIMYAIYAELNNKQYVYTPFDTIEHNYSNDVDFIRKKEWLINFVDNFEVNRDRTIIPMKYNSEYLKFFEANPIAVANSDMLKKIKAIFRANKNTDDYFNNQNLNIAVHMRRPNPHDSRILWADTPEDVFFDIIEKLRHMYASHNPLFHLYSQGDRNNFKKFNAQDIILHIDESIEETFISMVLADVLVVGTSSFSYSAGFLSEGVIYYMPWWHVPLPHWISVEKILK